MTSPIRRRRRSANEIRAIRDAIFDAVVEDWPMTVRQVFYRLVSNGVIEKREGEYKATVCRLLAEMRLHGELPFHWIADNTRWQRKPTTYSSLESALRRTYEAYRRSIWDTQDVYVEIWCEKDALAGVLYDVTEEWDVPLMVTRGYSSLSYLHGAAQAIAHLDKPALLYYFGDHDPSGMDIPRNVNERLREFAPDADIHFGTVAVTQQQIVEWGLPTRPTKRSDSRAKRFEGESVELDAIPPRQLRDLVKECIVQHVDPHVLDVTETAEKSEREVLKNLIREVA